MSVYLDEQSLSTKTAPAFYHHCQQVFIFNIFHKRIEEKHTPTQNKAKEHVSSGKCI